jgi:hypothetical protein
MVDDGALDQAQHVAHRGEQHLLGRHRIDHLRQRGGKVLRITIALAPESLSWCSSSRSVYSGLTLTTIAGPQDRCHRHRVLRHVGQHDRDPVALVQTQRLQVGGQRPRRVVDLTERHRLAHEDVGRQRAVLTKLSSINVTSDAYSLTSICAGTPAGYCFSQILSMSGAPALGDPILRDACTNHDQGIR